MSSKRYLNLDYLFDAYASFVVKHRKIIVIVWLAVIIVSIPFALESNSIVSYSINVPTSNNESQVAENIVSTQFPHYQQPNTTYYAILQGKNVLSPYFYQSYKQFNYSLSKDLAGYGIKSIDSIYNFEYSLLNTVFSNVTLYANDTVLLLNFTAQSLKQVRDNLTYANSKEYDIYSKAEYSVSQIQNLSMQLNQSNYEVYNLQSRINQTSYMLYGIPKNFADTWLIIFNSRQSGSMNIQQLNQMSNYTFVNNSNILSEPEPLPLYYSIFFDSWVQVTNSLSPSYVASNIYQIASKSIAKALPAFSSNFNQSEAAFFTYVANSFNITDYSNYTVLSSTTMNLSLSGLSSGQAQLVKLSYSLGMNPPYTLVEQAAVSYITSGLTVAEADFVQSAFQASMREGLANFTISYFISQVNSTYPSLFVELSKGYNVSIQQFASDAFNAGNPPNLTDLDNSSVSLVSSAIAANSSLVNLLKTRYNESVPTFVNLALNSTNMNSLQQNAVALVSKAIAYQASNQFYLSYNLSGLKNSVFNLYVKHANIFNLSDSLLSNNYLYDLPIYPDKGFTGQFVSSSRNTTIVIVTFRSPLNSSGQYEFERAVDSFDSPSFLTHYTATQILDNDVKQIISESERVALPFGVLVAIIVAGLFFLSPVSAFIPLVMFGISIEVGFALVDILLGHIQGERLSYISPIIISVLGLGLASDYVVLLMNRFRQELRYDMYEAARISARWAGEAVFTSALTVIMSYLALSLSGIPLFSDVGSANVIVVTVILLASMTFVPAIFSILGNRLFWPQRLNSNRPSRLAVLTKKSLSRPKTVVIILIGITAVSLVFAVSLPVNIDFLALAPNTPAKQGLDQITNNFGGSLLLPEYVVVQLSSPVSAGNNKFNISELNILNNIEGKIRDQQGVTSVFSLISPFNETINYQQLNEMNDQQREAIAEFMMNYLSSDNSTTYMKVILSGNPFGDEVLNEANMMQSNLSGNFKGFRILVGGISTDSYGVLQYVFQVLPKIIVVLIAAIFVVLFLQLRSVFTPLRLIATILSSVTWTLALVWLIFYHLSNLSIYVFAPLFLVTTMLGVGMDYDIFLITRVREEVMKGKEDEEAITATSETTGGVIAALGLILGSVFFGLVLTQVKLLQQIGLTLTFGVLLDTLVVWLMYVPAIMVLAKRLNWWPGDPRRKKRNLNKS